MTQCPKLVGVLLPTLAILISTSSWAVETDEDSRKVAAAQVPVEKLSEPMRSRVSGAIKQPTVFMRGPSEAFPCRPLIYYWLLDHHDAAFRLWKALGAECATIVQNSDGSFRGTDPRSGDLRWWNICREPGRRVWYAEGRGKANLFCPSIPVRAVILLNYEEVKGADGRTGIRHTVELFGQADSKAVNWATKAFGGSVATSTKTTIDQIELFFSGLAWYLSTQGEKARKLMDAGYDWHELDRLLGEPDIPRSGVTQAR